VNSTLALLLLNLAPSRRVLKGAVHQGSDSEQTGSQFTCFTGKKVQLLTQLAHIRNQPPAQSEMAARMALAAEWGMTPLARRIAVGTQRGDGG
jgi:hypothetical protein